MDWDKYAPYFSKKEFDCKVTGENRMRPDFMDLLLDIRKTYNKPMIITSGYRGKGHPIESSKQYPGEHTYGIAADIAVQGRDAMDLLAIAYHCGVRRIGVQQQGSGRYLHLGIGDRGYGFPVALWSY